MAQAAVVKTEEELCNAFDLFVHISVFTFFGLLWYLFQKRKIKYILICAT